MKRVRIDELVRTYEQKNGKKLPRKRIAEVVFRGENMKQSTKEQLIARLNNGHNMTRITVDHIERLKRLFKCTADDLFQYR